MLNKSISFIFFLVFSILSPQIMIAQWINTNFPTNIYIRCFTSIGSNLFAGGSGGVYLSNDEGTNWFEVNNGLTNKDVFSLCVSGDNLFAGTGSGVFISTNNGENWNPANSGLPYIVSSLATMGSCLFAGSYNGVYISTNNGVSWQNVGLGSWSVKSLFSIDSIIFAPVYFGGDSGGVFLSSDYGLNWTRADSGLNSYYIYNFAAKDTIIFTATNNGVYKSTNYGKNWISVSLGLPITYDSYPCTLANGDTNLFVGLYGGGVFLSTNNGTSWNSINSGLGNPYVQTIFINGKHLFSSNYDPYVPVGNGGSVWKLSIAEMVVSVETISINQPKYYYLEQNYPNPFNPSTTIRYQLPNDCLVTIKVFNILGEEIKTLVDKYETAGHKSVELDASNLPNGVYYYRFQSGSPSSNSGKGFSDVKKMLLVK
ncbi:MAG: T9SS type A sorting domain-containing protein [Ignavibacteriales bacterium]|nr:T9SS type A sorting domain-containing protein [Ignavibacteriales bacterium]